MFHKINLPLKDSDVAKLKIGDRVLLSGIIVTARDYLHKLLTKKKPKIDLKGGLIYHCGPITLKTGDEYRVLAAGPTTSIREEPYEDEIISTYKVKAIMGKGGMGEKTLKSLKKNKAVYLQTIGGAAQVLAAKIKRVVDVKYLHLSETEAMWFFEVEDFPAVVTMDCYGNSLYDKIRNDSQKKLNKLNDGE